MRTDLDHLPEGKRRELAVAVEIVRAGFAEALSRRSQERYRSGEILKIILFGSYARGDWVEDPIGRYFSDFDLLVVVNHEDLTDPSEFWGATEQQLLQALSSAQLLRTPVSLIVHSLEDVNSQLRLGRPFFVDILNDGVLLLTGRDMPFDQPRPLVAEEAISETRAYAEGWLGSARSLLDTAQYSRSKGELREAAFLLHQATERFYHTALLLRSMYSPKTHSLNRLRSLCEELDRRFVDIWTSGGRFERRCYELLRSAYVKARYSAQYTITTEELSWIFSRLMPLQKLVENIYIEQLTRLEAQSTS